VMGAPDVQSIYEVPLIMEKEGLAIQTLQLLQMEQRTPNLEKWSAMVDRLYSSVEVVKIAIVGKYIKLSDAYLSVVEALRHSSIATDSKLEIEWIDSEDLTAENIDRQLANIHGILVPGGFGVRGVDGKIAAIAYARQQNIPFFGLCLGMQSAVIEWARNIAHLPGAHSSEFDPETTNPVINLLPEQQDVVDMGGTMRLGLYPCRLGEGTLAAQLYQQEVVYERHRHRYEFNNAYRDLFLEQGYLVSGTSPDGRLVEIIELPSHPFFLATQFHPEFHSSPSTPHPLFKGFMIAAVTESRRVTTSQNGLDILVES
jgi:CTP synthase